MPIWFMVVLTVLAALVDALQRRPGARIYAVGGNAEAARLSGISRERTIDDGVRDPRRSSSGIAAVLFATQLSVIQSTVPPNLELTIITASVVGGVSILGGTGTVIGSTLAAILIAAIGSSLIFVNVSPYWLRAVQGVLILAHRARRHPAPAPPAALGRWPMAASDRREHHAARLPRWPLQRRRRCCSSILVAALVVLALQTRPVPDRSTTCSTRAG